MLSLPPAVRIFLCTEPTDMRRSFDGLALMVREVIGQDPLSGHLFVFRNRRRDRVKLLYWDRDGFALWYKRLEKGVFEFPPLADGRVDVDAATLSMLLEGIDISHVRRQRRYVRPVSA